MLSLYRLIQKQGRCLGKLSRRFRRQIAPTYLFLDSQQQEIRALRLTGAFKKSELLQQLTQLKEKSP
jgi:thiol:disulfide interchange protein